MAQWDILIRGGTLYDGSGRPGENADLAIAGGHIAALASREGCRMSKRSMLGLFELNGRGRCPHRRIAGANS